MKKLLALALAATMALSLAACGGAKEESAAPSAVSYTHLTLPTICSV